MSARNLGTFRTALQARLNDGDAGNYTATELNGFINEAYGIIQRRAKCHLVSETFTISTGVAYATLVNIFEPLVVTYGTTILTKTTAKELNLSDPAWIAAATGTPTKWYRRGGKEIGFYVVPNANTTGKVFGFAVADDMSADGQAPVGVPVGFEWSVLLDKAEAIARRARSTHANNVSRADELEKEFLLAIADLIDAEEPE